MTEQLEDSGENKVSGTNWQLRGRCRCHTEGDPAAFSPTQISRTNGLRQKWGGVGYSDVTSSRCGRENPVVWTVVLRGSA